jgi:hypothetical protein
MAADGLNLIYESHIMAILFWNSLRYRVSSKEKANRSTEGATADR